MTVDAQRSDAGTARDAGPTPERGPGTQPHRRRHRGRRIVGAAVTVAAIGAVGAGAVATAGLGDRPDPAAAPTPLPPSTAEVTRQTLRDTVDADGELGHGPTSSATSRRPGTVTWLPASGAQIGRGLALYKIDNQPVVLLYGAVPAYRNLAPGIEGPDVEQLERNLGALGYTGFTVDDDYSSATADAVRRWQSDHGLTETGVVELGRVVFAPDAVRVESLAAETGQPTAPGQKVLAYTGTTKVVTVRLEPEDQRLARAGAAVTVVLPDGKRVGGTVTEIATVIEPGQGSTEATTKLELLVTLADQAAAANFGQATVDVTLTASERKDVLTVPVAALMALKEGGFGVEVVEGGRTRIVAVQTGLFAGGRVEVTGDGLAAGLTVGMPR